MELPTPEDLRDRREELDLTQSQLAERADVSQPLIARIEGDDVDPRLSTLRRIVEALDEVDGDIPRAVDVMHHPVVTVAPDEDVRQAVDRMTEEGYSQLPVTWEDSPIGIISNSDVRRVDDDVRLDELPVADVMRESYTAVTPDATLNAVDNHLDHHDAVLVVDSGSLAGIITEADLAARRP